MIGNFPLLHRSLILIFSLKFCNNVIPRFMQLKIWTLFGALQWSITSIIIMATVRTAMKPLTINSKNNSQLENVFMTCQACAKHFIYADLI